MIKRIQLTRFKKYNSQTFDINSCGLSLIVGGNNSGKSTLLQALSVWEFCKMILLHEKGRAAFNVTKKIDGYGMSAEDFLPIAVPSLNHLWYNLKTQLSSDEKRKLGREYAGYILRIKCIWDYRDQHDKMVEIGLSLVNDRLFIRVTDSNISNDDYLPNIAYLPTLAGVLPKENKITRAERQAFLGKGMAGSIIRNMIYDLYEEDKELHKQLLGNKKKMSKANQENYIFNSPLQKLQTNLRNTFKSELEIDNFDENIHTVLRVKERKVSDDLTPLPKSKYTPRDIITLGSGFLQWLSIFCILYTKDIDIILLDEPDAHLHANLQTELLKKLSEATSEDKQILLSTHSVEIIKESPLENIFSIEKNRYLSTEEGRVKILHGIGSEYSQRFDLLKKYKKLLFVENDSDSKVIEILGQKCGLDFPRDIVIWPTIEQHTARRKIYAALKEELPELKCVSLRDRDMENINQVNTDLTYKEIRNNDKNLLLLEWRRKNIESYLLCPNAISKATGKQVSEIIKYLSEEHGLSVKESGNLKNEPQIIMEIDGKKIFKALEQRYQCNKYDVAKNIEFNEVCDDIKTFIQRMMDLFS